jgi:hypothetical protein
LVIVLSLFPNPFFALGTNGRRSLPCTLLNSTSNIATQIYPLCPVLIAFRRDSQNKSFGILFKVTQNAKQEAFKPTAAVTSC